MGEPEFDYFLTLRKIAETQPEKFKMSRWATVEETELLRDISQGYDQIIECGTANGWTALWMCNRDVQLDTIDIINRPKIYAETPYEKWIRFHHGTFADLASKIAETSFTNILFFIDGDHSYKAVKNDFKAIEENLIAGDKIVFHDSKLEEGVIKLVQKIREKYPRWHYKSYNTRNGIASFLV